MKKKVFSMLNALLGLLLALTPFVLFPVCGTPAPDGSPMRCHYSGLFIVAMGGLILAAAVPALRAKGRARFFRLSCILSAGAGLLAYLVPVGIVPLGNKALWGWECGLCGDVHHACRAVTLPAVGGLAAAVVLVNVLALIWDFVGGER